MFSWNFKEHGRINPQKKPGWDKHCGNAGILAEAGGGNFDGIRAAGGILCHTAQRARANSMKFLFFPLISDLISGTEYGTMMSLDVR